MKLNERQLVLFEWVKKCHGAQMRKYTFVPYWTHLLSVAEIVAPYDPEGNSLLIEIALCHDLLEDTSVSAPALAAHLINMGYSVGDTTRIVRNVQDLTDKFTHRDYPELNRFSRKVLESGILMNISPVAQTVKYADIIHNMKSIGEQDPNFAKIVVREVLMYLPNMDKGNPDLYKQCCDVIDFWFKTLSAIE